MHLEKDIIDLCKLVTSKFESGAQADLMGYMQILQTQAWNCHTAVVILRYAWYPLCVLPLLFSLNGGSMFSRLVWLKRNGNSICWVPLWRITISASGFHKQALQKKWNWYKVTLKQGKRVQKRHDFCRFTKSRLHCRNWKWAENSNWLCFIIFFLQKNLI